MNIFANTLKLRGFLGKDAEVPSSDGITDDAFTVLYLATMSGTWDIATNEWTPRTTSHRIVCPGPWFCGFTRGIDTAIMSKSKASFTSTTTTGQSSFPENAFPRIDWKLTIEHSAGFAAFHQILIDRSGEIRVARFSPVTATEEENKTRNGDGR